MNSTLIRKIGIGLVIGTILLLVLGSYLSIPISIKFFLGAFGIGAGVILVVVGNIVGLHHD